MATPHDALAKDILDVMLDDLGTFEREFEVSATKAQRGDVRFAPSPDHTEVRRALGLLGAMTELACLFEPFHEAPSPDEVRACLRKVLNARHAGALDPKRVVERSWLLCGGRPDQAIAELDARPMPSWPTGFYELRGLPLAIVVLAELPPRLDTLALRLMGAGMSSRAAFEDLCARYDEAPRGEALYEFVIQTHLAARRRGAPTESIMVDTSEARALIQNVFNRGLNKGLDEGRNEGRSEGLAPLAHLFARKLGRPLDEHERETLHARLDSLGPDRLGDVALDLDGSALALWLTDPNAR